MHNARTISTMQLGDQESLKHAENVAFMCHSNLKITKRYTVRNCVLLYNDLSIVMSKMFKWIICNNGHEIAIIISSTYPGPMYVDRLTSPPNLLKTSSSKLLPSWNTIFSSACFPVKELCWFGLTLNNILSLSLPSPGKTISSMTNIECVCSGRQKMLERNKEKQSRNTR